MKKLITIILTLALVMSLSVPVFAADDERQTNVSFTYDAPTPSYTVTIPAEITLSLDGPVSLAVEASNVENLGGRKIVVTHEDSSKAVIPYSMYTNERLAVSNANANGQYYSILGFSIGNSQLTLPDQGSVLLEFETNETKYLNFVMVTDAFSSAEDFDATRILPNSPYTGWITFGIKLVDA